MKCSFLLEQIKEYWPSEIVVTNDLESQLNSIYWQLDAKIDCKTQHWLSLSAWAFHQALGPFVQAEIAAGKKEISLHQMPMKLFNKQMLFNLKEECWQREYSEYIEE